MEVQSLKNGLTVLARLARRRPDQEGKLRTALSGRLAELGSVALSVAVEYGDPIGRVLTDVFREEGDAEIAEKLHAQIPLTTVALREFAVESSRTLVARERSKEGSTPLLLAARLHGLAHALTEAGRAKEALAAAEEEFNIWTHSTEGGADDGGDLGLAEAYLSLTGANLKLGRRMAALEAAREALSRIQSAVLSGKKEATRLLPNAQIVVAHALLEGGALREALTLCDEAIASARGRPGALAVEARLLAVRANAFRGLGDLGAALSAAQTGVERLRDLVDAQDDAYRPALQVALGDLSLRLVEAGDRQKAIEAADEGVSIGHVLADLRPNAFGPALAISMHDQAQCLENLGRTEDALETVNEAILDRTEISQGASDDARKDLAALEFTRARLLSRLGEFQRALDSSAQTVEIYRHLADETPGLFFPELAKSLGNRANYFRAAGDSEQALGASEAAVVAWRGLVKGEDGDSFRDELALALANHVAMLLDDADGKGALPLARESVQIFEQLAASYPSRYGDRHAWALAN
jgi:tetratricopeptide (TPR) repeat protein